MCKEEGYKRDDCKCQYCLQGIQGVPGLQGEQGVQGVPGAQGIAGQKGDQGIMGLQGPAGKDCSGDHPVEPCKCCEYFANIWAQPPQVLAAFGTGVDAVLFQFQNAVSAGDFDLSMMSIDGSIKFLKSGVYRINFGVEAKVLPPIPFPVPSFSFGLWLNNIIVPGSTISGFTQAVSDDTLQVTGEVMINIAANDVLKLRNASSNSVDMAPNVTGILFPVTVSTMNINCLKAA